MASVYSAGTVVSTMAQFGFAKELDFLHGIGRDRAVWTVGPCGSVKNALVASFKREEDLNEFRRLHDIPVSGS